MMEMDAIARTAFWTTAARARESAYPDRLFDDLLAEAFAGAERFAHLDAEAAALRARPAPEESATGGESNPVLPIRTRFFDDWLNRVTTRDGVRQVVFVAASLDTRTFRLAWPAGVTLLELDRPALLADEAILAAASATPACDRRTVGSQAGVRCPQKLVLPRL